MKQGIPVGNHHLSDTNQSVWSLAAIQLTGVTSLPLLAASILLLQQHDFLSAIVTLILGNVLLWIIRVVIVLMSCQKRHSTLDLARVYFGQLAGYPIAIALLASTMIWFIAQTTMATDAFIYLTGLNRGQGANQFMRYAAILGIISTCFCMEGIRMLKWLSLVMLPILLVAFIGVFASAPHQPIAEWQNSFSLSGLAIVMGTNLGVTADLPTFFRHSRSRRTSIYALTVIQMVSLVIGFAGLYLGTIISPWAGLQQNQAIILSNTFLRTWLAILVVGSAICANVANVYSASVGWELVAPILAGRREYLILGLGLTILFLLLANLLPLEPLLEIADTLLVNLAIVLVVGYVVCLIIKRPPGNFEKAIYFSSWLAASVINALQSSGVMPSDYSGFVSGAIIIVVVALVAIACKEIVLRGLSKRRRS